MCKYKLATCKSACYALSQNKKIKGSGAGQFVVYNWTIPAFFDPITRTRTCPAAGVCAKEGGCYAMQGAYKWTPTMKAHSAKLSLYLDSPADWRRLLDHEIGLLKAHAAKQGKRMAIRVHDAGDFFDDRYFEAWLHLATHNPDVVFYAYTKQVLMVADFQKRGDIPVNFTLICSEGGIYDQAIHRKGMRHSRVFATHADLHEAGYADATEDDTVAFLTRGGKVGLVYHGAAKKAWTTHEDKLAEGEQQLLLTKKGA